MTACRYDSLSMSFAVHASSHLQLYTDMHARAQNMDDMGNSIFLIARGVVKRIVHITCVQTNHFESRKPRIESDVYF